MEAQLEILCPYCKTNLYFEDDSMNQKYHLKVLKVEIDNDIIWYCLKCKCLLKVF